MRILSVFVLLAISAACSSDSTFYEATWSTAPVAVHTFDSEGEALDVETEDYLQGPANSLIYRKTSDGLVLYETRVGHYVDPEGYSEFLHVEHEPNDRFCIPGFYLDPQFDYRYPQTAAKCIALEDTEYEFEYKLGAFDGSVLNRTECAGFNILIGYTDWAEICAREQ